MPLSWRRQTRPWETLRQSAPLLLSPPLPVIRSDSYKHLESEGTNDDPQYVRFLFPRTCSCRIGRLFERAAHRASRRRERQDPGEGPGCSHRIDRVGRLSERGWTFRLPCGWLESLPPLLQQGLPG